MIQDNTYLFVVTNGYSSISYRRNERKRSWYNSGTELQYILFYHFEQLICVFSVVQKFFCHIWFKPVLLNFLFLSCHIVNTVNLIRVINKPKQLHSYRAIWEYKHDQCRDPFCIGFTLVLRILLKAYRQ